nr:hypothetical protein [Tanacetum cinerariifolium]GEV71035.1 hypothetical protein [Tanacetum cinerariifolium]
MLDKDLYDSWKSRMDIYMQNREHRRMILESVEHELLIWPTIEENGVAKTKKYVELFAAEKIQADCDMKATNIIFQGLPSDIYSLINHHRVAKYLWERIQLLMQGTSLTKAKVTAIEEAKDLDTLPLDELIKNLKVYEMFLDNDGIESKITKEKVKSLAFKVNITRGQTSNNSRCQGDSDEDEEINLIAKNFRKLSQKGVKVHDKFDICKVKTKGGESSRRKRECYNCGNKNHLVDNYPKPTTKHSLE